MDLATLGDDELLHRLKDLVRQEREDIAAVAAHLAEVAAATWPASGPTRRFEYCVKELGCSEVSAFHRIRAARAARKRPELSAHEPNELIVSQNRTRAPSASPRRSLPSPGLPSVQAPADPLSYGPVKGSRLSPEEVGTRKRVRTCPDEIVTLSRDRPSQAGFPVLLADVGKRLSEPPHVRLWDTIEVFCPCAKKGRMVCSGRGGIVPAGAFAGRGASLVLSSMDGLVKCLGLDKYRASVILQK